MSPYAPSRLATPPLIALKGEVREIMLEAVRQNAAGEYMFVNPETGKPYTDLKKGFAAACAAADIRNLRWHDLRHTFGTRLAEAGCSEATISELMGHTDPKTTRRYTHGTDRAKREAVEATRPRTEIKQEQPKVVSISQ